MSEIKRMLTVGFDKDVAVFYPESYKLAKKMLEQIYNAKIIFAADGKVEASIPKLREVVT
jgi:hypothetical protein